jgi:hypothetical protein
VNAESKGLFKVLTQSIPEETKENVYTLRQAGPSVTATGTENVHQNQMLSRCQAVRYYEMLLKQMVRTKTKSVHTECSSRTQTVKPTIYTVVGKHSTVCNVFFYFYGLTRHAQ